MQVYLLLGCNNFHYDRIQIVRRFLIGCRMYDLKGLLMAAFASKRHPEMGIAFYKIAATYGSVDSNGNVGIAQGY